MTPSVKAADSAGARTANPASARTADSAGARIANPASARTADSANARTASPGSARSWAALRCREAEPARLLLRLFDFRAPNAMWSLSQETWNCQYPSLGQYSHLGREPVRMDMLLPEDQVRDFRPLLTPSRRRHSRSPPCRGQACSAGRRPSLPWNALYMYFRRRRCRCAWLRRSSTSQS